MTMIEVWLNLLRDEQHNGFWMDFIPREPGSGGFARSPLWEGDAAREWLTVLGIDPDAAMGMPRSSWPVSLSRSNLEAFELV